MEKSPDAFRTISEVADELDLPQHVLRFWETRFSQIKPMKRGGGRRLYRPDHIALLRGIKALLYEDGMTIKGVQKLLRETGGKPEKIREGLISAERPARQTTESPSAPPPPAATPLASPSAPQLSSLSPDARSELKAVLRELVQLKGRLDGALSGSSV